MSSLASPISESSPILDQIEWSEDEQSSNRKVYGGKSSNGRGGGFGLIRTAFQVSSSCLSIGPLIIAHAFQLTGLAIGLPILFIIAALSWMSHTSLAVQARYVGAMSMHRLAKAVFPKGKLGRNAGYTMVDLFTIFVALSRGISILYASTSLFAAFALKAVPKATLFQNTVWTSIVVTLFFLVPSLIPNHRRNRLLNSSIWSLIHAAGPVVYLIVLVILGVRIHNIKSRNKTLERRAFYASLGSEAMGTSIWGGIAIILWSLVSHQSSFAHQRELRQTSKTSIVKKVGLKTVKQHGWETASFFGLLATSLILLAYGLVGFLAVPLPPGYGQPANIISALPVDDGWLACARLLLTITLLAGLPATLRPARKAIKRLLMMPVKLSVMGDILAPKHNRTQPQARDNVDPSDESDDEDEDRSASRRYAWVKHLATLVTYLILAIITLATVRNDQDLASLVEISGCLGSTSVGFILPAAFFITLFHVRKARSIFVPDLSNPIVMQDELLLKKEAQLQRRLSGRRLHQDFIVFAGMLPLGLVIFMRGCIALATVPK